MPRKRSFFGLLSSGEGNSAEGRNNRTADSGSTDYLSSFSTLKDLYRHEFERRQKRGEDEYRIVVVGASGVDKSAICVRFVQGSLMTKVVEAANCIMMKGNALTHSFRYLVRSYG